MGSVSSFDPDEEDAGPFSGDPFRDALRYAVRPNRHDHVGHMVFTDEVAWCSVCGQEWEMRRTTHVDPVTGDDLVKLAGWLPLPPAGRQLEEI